MKPEKLVMSAFGSYGGREEIDFTNVNGGMFLITGDTGAGKTTVFDAITYALFDETSGGRREGEMMRSQFAGEEVPTYVELFFSYGGKQYKVRRNPGYQRLSKRKNKDGAYTYTWETPAVELTLPDGTVFPGKSKETNEKLRELLGVDVHQFTQISMIAQGDFLKLLHAPSRERKEIFARIFDTKIYWQIQNRLKEESRELYVRLSDNLVRIRQELSGVVCPEEGIKEAWGRAAEQVETGREEILRLLKEMEELLQSREENLRSREQKAKEEADRVKLQTARAKEINGQFQRLQETKASIEEIEKKRRELLKKLAEWNGYLERLAETGRIRLPELEQELAKAQNLLPKYESYEQRKRHTRQLEQDKAQAAGKLAQLEQQETALNREIQELQTSQKELVPRLEQLPGVIQQEKEAGRRKMDLADLQSQKQRIAEAQKELAAQREQMALALTQFEEKSREYERKNRSFIEAQAGFMARELADENPCPVCGSRSHPHKAELSKEAVTQNQVEEAKAVREQAQLYLDKNREQFQSRNQELAGEFQVFLHNWQRIFNNNSDIQQSVEPGLKTAENQKEEPSKQKNFAEEIHAEQIEIIEQEIQTCQKRLTELADTRRTLEQLQQKYRLQGEQLEKALQTVAQLGEQKDQAMAKAHEAAINYEKALQSLTELEETLTYPSQEALMAAIYQLQQEKNQFQSKQANVQETISTLRQQMDKGDGALEEQKKNLSLLQESLAGKEPIDTTLLNRQELTLQEQQNAIEEQKLLLVSIKTGNQRAAGELAKLYRERENLMETYEIADTLSRTANGNLPKQARLDLQTYVQRRYFQQIIGEANRRLIKMSDGRFLLRCRDLNQLAKQGEAGLDLDVYDLVTDRVRDVKTLSGGESFLAALSMALGMADVIQKSAGRVQLDTMFIDEGFGSLDDEARENAIRILQELAGKTRLVGIISHVTEMKEQMDVKLVITKTDKGSHAAWQIES